MSDEITQKAVSAFLTATRSQVGNLGLDFGKLPAWVSAAKVRYARINDAVLVIFEDSPDQDYFRDIGTMHVDTAALFDIPDFESDSYYFDACDQDIARARKSHLVIWQGIGGGPGGLAMALQGPKAAFRNVGYCGYFSPLGLLNMFLQFHPDIVQPPSALRFIPFALYIHEQDLDDLENLNRRCVPKVLESLQEIHESEEGDYYANLHRRISAFGINHDNGVIVLGSYGEPQKSELLQIRDSLRQFKYDAHLIEDLPESPLMSLPDKVRFWTGASRFSVMIDRNPSGHLNEYEILRHQESILALLHRRGSGSTRMIGVESLNYNFIRDFEFLESPLEVIAQAAAWAEDRAQERIETYARKYPWKASGVD
jgi:hypothetical protein